MLVLFGPCGCSVLSPYTFLRLPCSRSLREDFRPSCFRKCFRRLFEWHGADRLSKIWKHPRTWWWKRCLHLTQRPPFDSMELGWPAHFELSDLYVTKCEKIVTFFAFDVIPVTVMARNGEDLPFVWHFMFPASLGIKSFMRRCLPNSKMAQWESACGGQSDSSIGRSFIDHVTFSDMLSHGVRHQNKTDSLAKNATSLLVPGWLLGRLHWTESWSEKQRSNVMRALTDRSGKDAWRGLRTD